MSALLPHKEIEIFLLDPGDPHSPLPTKTLKDREAYDQRSCCGLGREVERPRLVPSVDLGDLFVGQERRSTVLTRQRR